MNKSLKERLKNLSKRIEALEPHIHKPVVHRCIDQLPPDNTPVLVFVYNEWQVGAIHWERPTHEESFEPFRYWQDINDTFEWQWYDVTHWAALPDNPEPYAYNPEEVELEERITSELQTLDDGGSIWDNFNWSNAPRFTDE